MAPIFFIYLLPVICICAQILFCRRLPKPDTCRRFRASSTGDAGLEVTNADRYVELCGYFGIGAARQVSCRRGIAVVSVTPLVLVLPVIAVANQFVVVNRRVTDRSRAVKSA
jgi:hypothetical protein